MMQDGGGGKFRDALQVPVLQIIRGVQAAAGQDGVLDAGGQKIAESYLQCESIQFFWKDVAGIINHIL